MHIRSFWLRFDLVTVLFLGMAVAFLVESWKMMAVPKLQGDVIGLGGFPLALSILWVVTISIVVAIEAIKQVRHPSYKINIHDIRLIRWLAIIVLGLLFVFVVRHAGFIATSSVYMAILMISFGATKKGQIVRATLLSIAIVLAIYFTYLGLFKLPLPGMI